MDELMAAVAEQARSDVEAEGMPRDLICMSSHGDDDEGVPILDGRMPPCRATLCPERRRHHHVAVCGRILLQELVGALGSGTDAPFEKDGSPDAALCWCGMPRYQGRLRCREHQFMAVQQVHQGDKKHRDDALACS